MIRDGFWWISLIFPLTLIVGIATLNALTWPRLKRPEQAPAEEKNMPLLSVLIPARNEAHNLPETLSSWLAQRYPRLEILVLDDASEDDTAQIVQSFAARDPRLRLLRGAPLPPGWRGKNWACHQLAQAAQGDYLLFTDADVRWDAEAVEAAMKAAQSLEADLLALWPHQETESWSEYVLVPLIPLAVTFYLPVLAAHHIAHPALAAAIGQALLFRRKAYEAIGGHAALAANPLDDITLAQHIKAHGLALRLVEASQLIRCRMYRSWSEVRNGLSRSLLSAAGNRPWPLLAGVFLQLYLFLLPPLGWLLSWLFPFGQTLFPRPLFALAYGLSLTARLIGALVHRQRLSQALLMPLSVTLLVLLAFWGLWQRHRYGGMSWKGRLV